MGMMMKQGGVIFSSEDIFFRSFQRDKTAFDPRHVQGLGLSRFFNRVCVVALRISEVDMTKEDGGLPRSFHRLREFEIEVLY